MLHEFVRKAALRSPTKVDAFRVPSRYHMYFRAWNWGYRVRFFLLLETVWYISKVQKITHCEVQMYV